MMPGVDLAGSRPCFPRAVGGSLIDSLPLSHFGQKRLLFGEFERPGQVHVYSANCHAGERLRAQTFVPVLPRGGSVTPAIAVVAQGLPYTADAQALPVDLPKGYGAIVVHPPSVLHQPVQDLLTRVQYYPGPLVDTRTLVGGRCYLVVWSPHNHMGKYVVQTGHAWPWQWTYWLQLPLYWWRIRGWFGLSRAAAYVAGLVTLALLLVLFRPTKR
ncbi:MAG: hypothetical protein D6790_12185 [Caldilineae bacterium]|nr:MAG: hypothetical protein D6790_12185 [Caldilineae bacterium]